MKIVKTKILLIVTVYRLFSFEMIVTKYKVKYYY